MHETLLTVSRAITESSNEQTTALTDLFLSVQAILSIAIIARYCASPSFRIWLWHSVLTLMGIGSLLGAIAHGFKMSGSTHSLLWIPIYLALGLLVALYALAAVAQTWNEQVALRFLPSCIGIAILFFSITQLWSDSFQIFVMYESVMMLFSLLLYSTCLWSPEKRDGSGFMVAGSLVSLLAAYVDAQPNLLFTCYWTFNNHGVFHLIQMLSLVLILAGILRSCKPEQRTKQHANDRLS